ncbi:hypothetical protein GPJ56_007559 [Histomonas meleagridis]|uniref:uncharacterized protein n=1 Tax=Histomonas meleagridis TaxID=135588 RepID=UPI0035599A3C|nr:hypothetical protein GPJ56_007559 [Histomonas meleagridis]KAH0806078.1 hypothetical protein GO595_001091 [Histomonas meleagridis]
MDSSLDTRPVSGMVGQKCLGYCVWGDGKLVRIIPKDRDENCIGPGTYNLKDPESEHKGATISPSSNRLSFLNTDQVKYRVGPSDHFSSETNTKLPHKISGSHKSLPSQPLISGNLTHKSWVSPLPSQTNIQRRFPRTNFKKTNATRQFLSKQERDLFNLSRIEIKDNKPTEYEETSAKPEAPQMSACFRSDLPRFAEPNSITPSPCQYNIKSQFGTGNKFSFSPLWIDIDKEPPEITPGPGDYDPYKSNNGAPRKPIKTGRGYIVSKKNKKQNTKKVKPKTPSPGSYNIKEKDTKMPISIHNKDNLPYNRWYQNSSEAPPPGYYRINEKNKIVGGVISRSAAKKQEQRKLEDEDEEEDISLPPQHSGFIKPTYNFKYKTSISKFK